MDCYVKMTTQRNDTLKTLGLYIHVPFCKAKCAYCDFYSLSGAEERMDAYLDALRVQLDAYAGRAAGYVVDTLYVGGGTPSYLGAARLLRLFDAVNARYAVAPDAEITLEVNPDSVGAGFDALRRAGFNRVSLGMQSADDTQLRALGRVHTFIQVRAAVDTLRRAGFDNLSLDLMYGLPGQSAASWRESVRAAADLNPEHLSCYGLKLEPGTPLYARRGAYDLPGDDEQADMYLWAADALSGYGYRQYEISNFARPGRESRHNLKYWTLGAYLGFGPGAHSDFDGVRFAWTRDLSTYLRGAWETSESARVTDAERAREWIMLGLRTAYGLDPYEYRRRFGRDFACFTPFFDQCVSAGYAARDKGRVALTPRGFLVSNAIIGRALEIHDFLSNPEKNTCAPSPDSI